MLLGTVFVGKKTYLSKLYVEVNYHWTETEIRVQDSIKLKQCSALVIIRQLCFLFLCRFADKMYFVLIFMSSLFVLTTLRSHVSNVTTVSHFYGHFHAKVFSFFPIFFFIQVRCCLSSTGLPLFHPEKI